MHLEQKLFICYPANTVITRSSKDECRTGSTIILGLQIFLDHRSLSSIGQKVLMILFEVDGIGDDSDDDL